MDYKGLITEIRMYIVKKYQVGFQPEICSRAADAIETLLAERDAAIADLKWFAESVYNPYPCDLCIHCPSDGSICTKMSEDCWQWRGPQKHD